MQTTSEFWWAFALGSLALLTLGVAYILNVVASQRKSLASRERQIREIKEREDELRVSQQQLRTLAARIQSVREEERLRLSREVHDELGQVLTVLKIHLKDIIEELKEHKKGSRTRAWNKLTSLIDIVDSSITLVKQISSELRPIVLDELGLKEAIEWEARQAQSRSGIDCRLNLAVNSISLKKSQQIEVFRILQEAMTNVLRHSNATTMTITMAQQAGAFTMNIQDNGRGILAEQVNDPASLGLIGMRERALVLGGTITFTANHSGGTHVSLRVPLLQSLPANGLDQQNGGSNYD